MGMLAGEAGALSLHFLPLECLCLVLFSQFLSEPAKRAATVCRAVEGKTRMCHYLQAGFHSSLVPAGAPETGSLVLTLEGKQSLKISEGIAE